MALYGTLGTTISKTVLPTGSLLQAVTTTKTDGFSASGSTGSWYSVTGLSASITPISSSNKILVLVNLTTGMQSSYNALGVRVTRNGTATYVGNPSGSRNSGAWGSDDLYGAAYNLTVGTSIIYLDSPASTSSLTYQVQLMNSRDTESVTVNFAYNDADNAQTWRAASSITLMEITG